MRAAAVALLTVAALAAGCSDDTDPTVVEPVDTPTATTTGTTTDPSPEPADDPLDIALSEPVEDSVYPDVGDPGVDALHYDLELTWAPATDRLTGHEVLTFRATTDADSFQLDFSEVLAVSDGLTVDGDEVSFEQRGKDLVVDHPVVADQRYVLDLRYQGTPEPVDSPTTRSDFVEGVGFTIDDQHQTWTMQEPYGAFTWYAVNDQPADKALYDFTLDTTDPFVGVANGEQVDDESTGGARRTTYHLAEPASSYLVTVAFGDYEKTDDTGPRGLPITYWTPRGQQPNAGLRSAPDAIVWLEQHLGPYPFDTAGFVLVDSQSGMETQTMITLGDDPRATSASVVLHELAHQWYGDQVSPDDWRDVWMNEGMATYLEQMWNAEQQGVPFDDWMAQLVDQEAEYRAESGPPGAYDPDEFAQSNVYYSGAFLWHELRHRVGDDVFFDAVRGWPTSQDNQSSDRETLLAYLEEQTGEDLDEFWDAWLLGETTPPLHTD